jgi:hypothetical protein
MPTNLLRDRNRAVPPDRELERHRARKPRDRRIVITAGRVKIRAQLLDTPTAERVWQALPLHSTAETWGQAIHFETPVESGRERNARLLSEPGDIYFWVEGRPGGHRLRPDPHLAARRSASAAPLQPLGPCVG